MKTILKITFVLLLGYNLMGCMPLQDNYEYEPVNASPYIYMTAWEFINARQDVYSSLKEAIEYVETAYPGTQALYSQTEHKYTYMFMTNDAFKSLLWRHSLSTIQEMDVELLHNILLYHIVDGCYHSLSAEGNLGFDNIYVVTLLRSQDAVMSIKLDNRAGRGSYSRLVVNDDSSNNTAVSSNIVATNGIINSFNKPLIYTL